MGNRASTYESVWQDEVNSRVHLNNGGGVMHVPERTVAEGMKPLGTGEDNSAGSHDLQARGSAGDKGG